MKLVAVLACSFGLIAWLAGAVESAREAARRAQCSCQYCQILLALHNYHSEFTHTASRVHCRRQWQADA